MHALTILTCCLLVLGTAYGAPKWDFQSETRIVNGTAAKPGQFPFIVSLFLDGYFLCGGSIVNERWIMTAGHCVYGMNGKFSVRAGTTDLYEGGVLIDAEEAIHHEDYDPYEIINDVAVIKLETPLVMSDVIQPVTLPKLGQGTPGDLEATVIGWGRLSTGGPIPTDLQYVKIKTYSDEECYRLHDTELKPKPSNICAGVPEGGKGQCSGDSGGPLIVNGYQAGIVSWSVKPCAIVGYPGVFTETSYFVDWVLQHTS